MIARRLIHGWSPKALADMRVLHGAATALLATVTGSLAASTRGPAAVPKAYFVQLHQTGTIAGRGATPLSLVDKAAEASVPLNVRYEFNNADVFHGLSVTLEDDAHVGVLRDLPEVADIFPVREIPRPEAQLPELQDPSSSSSGADADPSWWSNLTLSINSPPNRRAPGSNSAASSNGSSANFNSPHSMTSVDRLHQAGIRGKGVRVAVIDTGVDWRHPALGGCFGPGCKIEFGYDFVGDDYGSGSAPNPKPDPIATCFDGFHGTHVTGV
ncbi:hypothetical protein SLS62_000623 [Diatrype stigma]|uniref:Peptidase S8/S53 domain-containing protein n=1 Tax=Diatrype stigma TaxID=117547 RepID=A0AAN9YSP4_9PEZI